MKYIVRALLLCLAVETTFCNDEECIKESKNVNNCVKQKHQDNLHADEAAIEKLKEKIDKCFTDNNCTKSNFTALTALNPETPLVGNTPEDVNKCLNEEAKKDGIEQLNECLKKKNVDTVKDDFLEGFDQEADDKRGFQAIASVKVALKVCKIDKGNSTAKKVADCIKPLKEEVQKEICERANDCQKEANVSVSCKKRFEEIRDASCHCARETIEESKKRVEALQANEEDTITLEQLKNISTQGASYPDAVLETLEKCYKQTKHLPPTYLAILKNASKNGPPPGVVAKLPKHQSLDPIEESLTNALDDLDCQFCKLS